MVIPDKISIISTVIFTILVISQPNQVTAARQLSDSIMDIMNMRHISERLNLSRERNNLEESALSYPRAAHQPPEIAINLDTSSVRQNQPVVIQYNDSLIPYTPGVPSNRETDILTDLQAFRTDKLLKSSKNALFVTRKEYLKKDWCKTEPLVQRIREDGCLSRTIMNRFCYGQCNSFYIPKSPKRGRAKKRMDNSLDEFEPEDLTGAAFRSCAFCKPKKFTWITVTLRCPTLIPQVRRKRIQRIKQCKCMAEPLN